MILRHFSLIINCYIKQVNMKMLSLVSDIVGTYIKSGPVVDCVMNRLLSSELKHTREYSLLFQWINLTLTDCTDLMSTASETNVLMQTDPSFSYRGFLLREIENMFFSNALLLSEKYLPITIKCNKNFQWNLPKSKTLVKVWGYSPSSENLCF